MRRNKILLSISSIGALALGFLTTAPANATTNSGSMQVTANVQGTCSIATPTLDFGNLPITGGNTQATTGTTSATITCTTGLTPTQLAIGNGLYDSHAAGTGYNFALNSTTTPGQYLSYGLSVVTPFATGTAAIPPDGTGGPANNTVTTGLTAAVPIYGEIEAAQTVIVGSYDDTVTLTVTY